MMKRILAALLCILLLAGCAAPGEDFRLTMEYTQDETGQTIYCETTYDSDGRMVRQEQYSGREHVATVTYVWDGNTSTGTTVDAAGTVTGVTVSVYDEWGNLLHQQIQDGSGNLLSQSWYAYEGQDGHTSGKIPR